MKYYKSFRLQWLRDRALYWRISTVLIKVLYHLWRSPMVFRSGAHHCPLIQCAGHGLPAGDIFDDVFVKVYAVFEFDLWSNRNPGVSLGSYVDDDAVSAHGPENAILHDLTKAATDLKWVLQT
eukprot:8521066-Pyramimonas_sp.AAC.1